MIDGEKDWSQKTKVKWEVTGMGGGGERDKMCGNWPKEKKSQTHSAEIFTQTGNTESQLTWRRTTN